MLKGSSAKPKTTSPSNHQTQQHTIVPNVAVSEGKKQSHPFFLQGKDDPLLAESLPPKVRGACLGEIFLCVHAIMWTPSDSTNKSSIQVHPIWWGSDDRSISLSPSTIEDQDGENNFREERSKVAVRYPVKSPEEVFRAYLSSKFEPKLFV